MILKTFEGLIRIPLSKEFFHFNTFSWIDLNLDGYEDMKFGKFSGEIGHLKPKWRLCLDLSLRDSI